jgi:hypothetical protein
MAPVRERTARGEVETRRMSLASTSVSLIAIAGILSTLLAGATIWLLLTNPVAVADSVRDGNLGPAFAAVTNALIDAVQALLAYL